MKKLALVLAVIVFTGTLTFAERIEAKTKTEIIKKDSIKKAKIDTAMKTTTTAIANADSLIKGLQKEGLKTNADGTTNWYYSIICAILFVMQFAANAYPSVKNLAYFKPISALVRLLVGLAKGTQALSTGFGLFKNRKKGGGFLPAAQITLTKETPKVEIPAL